MRRIKKRKIKLYRIFLYLVLFLSIALAGNYAYSRLINQLDINGVSKIEKSEFGFSCEGNVTYEIQKWPNGNNLYMYRMVINLENTGYKGYNSWNIYFDIPLDFSMVSNSSSEYQISGNKLKLSSVYYNSSILSGNSISFEIQFVTSNSNYEPNNISVNECYLSQDNEMVTNGLNVEYVFISTDNYNTYQYNVIVTNNNNVSINNWNFSIKKPSNASIINVWDANYIVKDDLIEFSNVLHNGNLAPGQSVNFGMVIYTDDKNYTPMLYE